MEQSRPHRLPVLLTKHQSVRLKRIAKKERVSLSHLIREAVTALIASRNIHAN